MDKWSDEEIVYVSAIEHYGYCPRQYALIHIENVFDENIFTLRGSSMHENADVPEGHEEDGIIVERAIPIWSDTLGLIGKTDVVEFHPNGTIYPVEYKSGPRGDKLHDDLQLCAQVLCLEEMLEKNIEKGAIYYFSSRKRREVNIDNTLRDKTKTIILRIRELQISSQVPPPVNDNRCRNCSLINACIPSVLSHISEESASELFIPVKEIDER